MQRFTIFPPASLRGARRSHGSRAGRCRSGTLSGVGLALLGLTLVAVACGPDSDEPGTLEPTPFAAVAVAPAYTAQAVRPGGIEPARAAAREPDSALGDVPGFPGAQRFMRGTLGDGRPFVSLRSAEDPTRVYVFYDRALFALGWDVVASDARGRGYEIRARKAERAIRIRIEASGAGCEIAIETDPIEGSQRGPQGPPPVSASRASAG